MKTRALDGEDGRRTYALVFDIGDEVTDRLLAFAREHELHGAYFTAIGAFQDVVLGYWQ